MIVIDTSVLGAVLLPDKKKPLKDMDTNKVVENLKERFDCLLSEIRQSQQRIIIPTPVLSEILVYSGSSFRTLQEYFYKESAFKIVPFDRKAAIVAAETSYDPEQLGYYDGTDKRTQLPKVKIKFDKQIVAIATVAEATKIYTNDRPMRNYAKRCGFEVCKISDIALPLPSDLFW